MRDMRDTDYATELATAALACVDKPSSELRVERLLVKALGQEEIRWSWWVDGRMTNRPLDLTEEQLLDLMQLGMKHGVFTTEFLVGLRKRINGHLGPA